MRNEAEVIAYLARRFPAGGRVRVGIGDDAAVLAGDARHDWVLTTDLLIEGVHFLDYGQPKRGQRAPARALGWKALARSLSDIAAMGAWPRAALVALAVPADTPTAWVKAFFAGLDSLARRYGVRVIGGDLSRAPQIVADVQAIGVAEKGRAVLRRGARPGDVIFLSGRLGWSRLGLAALRQRLPRRDALLRTAVRAHFFPQPRLGLARRLARRGVTAMIDISDGLSTDLGHLCEASRVGARILAERIPAVRMPVSLERRLKTTGLELALHGGEDYELLFTLPPARAARLPRKLEGVELTAIGEITRNRQVWLVDAGGGTRRLAPRGWDPFRRGRLTG